MRKLLTIGLLTLFCFTVSGIDHAEAKRFGGGSSFGKSFNNRSMTPAPRMSQQKKVSTGKQGTAAPARSGIMGMLGGLALGGLLGAMFFGGAFEGINFFDIFVIAAIIFGFIWLLRRKTQSSQAYAYAGRQPEQPTQADLFTASEQTSGQMLRPDIDESHFIAAAKDIFMRMQAAWDNKDMQDIRTFCTPEVAAKIESDMHALGKAKACTEVAMLEAAIADSWIESDDEWVAVNFHAMLKEETLTAEGEKIESQAHEMHETWIFRHTPNSDDPTWYLAGIQQPL